jgi:6,7-dimethyl-8-ribityllumazine synthase
MSNRQIIYDALVEHAKGHIKKHAANVEIYLEKAVGVGEHPDVLEAIEKELAVIAQYHDQLEVLAKYIKRD